MSNSKIQILSFIAFLYDRKLSKYIKAYRLIILTLHILCTHTWLVIYVRFQWLIYSSLDWFDLNKSLLKKIAKKAVFAARVKERNDLSSPSRALSFRWGSECVVRVVEVSLRCTREPRALCRRPPIFRNSVTFVSVLCCYSIYIRFKGLRAIPAGK